MTKGHNKEAKPEIREKGKQDSLKHSKRDSSKGGRNADEDQSEGRKGKNSI